jgi:hypothetical protein
MSAPRRALCAASTLVIAGALLVAGASTALAAGVTATTVTSVTGAPTGYAISNDDLPPASSPQITATGTAVVSAPGDTVDVRCYYQLAPTDYFYPLASNVPVTAGTWTATGTEADIADYNCRIVAVPHNWMTSLTDPSSASFVPSSTLLRLGAANTKAESAPNAGAVYSFNAAIVGAHADNEFNALTECATETVLGTPDPEFGTYLWDCVVNLYDTDEGSDGDSVASRDPVQIGGHEAYPPGAIDDVPSLTAGGIVVSFTQNATTGNAVIQESEPYYYCLNGTGTILDTGAPGLCAGARYTGVTLHRTYTTGNGGETDVVADRFASTDGQIHSLSLEYENDFDGVSTNSEGFRLPGSSSYVAPSAQTAVNTGGWPQVGSLGVVADQTAPTANSITNPVGALTWSTRPNSAYFLAADVLFLNYQRTIPAGGSFSLTHSLALSTSQSSTDALAAAQVKADKPTITTTAPAKTGTGKVAIAGKVIQGGNGAITSVAVKVGKKRKSAAVSATGAYSLKVKLAKGTNHVTVTGTDPVGNAASVAKTVHYVNPVTTKKPKHRGRTITVTVKCAKFAATSGCRGKVELKLGHKTKADHKFHVKRGKTRKVTVTAPASLAGHTVTLVAVYKDPTGGALTTHGHKITVG